MGPQRRCERGERAAARGARDGALRTSSRTASGSPRSRARARAPTGPVRRRLDLLHNVFLPQQTPAELRSRIIELEASVEMRFSQHRGDVDGAASTTTRSGGSCERATTSAERRAAWEASKTVGAAVAEDVRELARLRNAAAHSLGYRDWFALSVATSEMDEDKLMATLDEADRATAEPFARWKAGLDDRLATRFGCAVGRPPAVALRRCVLPGGAAGGRRRSRRRSSRTRISWRSHAAPTTGSGSRRVACSTAATSSRATASASTRSASTSTGPATSACSRTSFPASSGRTRCCTSSVTPRSTPASTRRCRGSCATPIS